MNRLPHGFMKIKLFLTLLMLFLTLVVGCDIINPKEVEITVKHVVILPTGTIIEASAPLNVSNAFGFLRPKLGDNDVKQNSSFILPISIKNELNKDFKNTKIKFIYEKKFIEKMYVYSKSKEPLTSLGEDTYSFDNDLIATQEATILVAGKAGQLTDGLVDGRVKYSVIVLDENNQPINEINDTIVITIE